MNAKILLLALVSLCMANAGHAQTLRLLTYNIHHAQNESGVVDIKGLAEFIVNQKPDVVALQEVDSVCGRSNRIDIAAELGKLTGMYYYFGKAMNYDGGGYGEAILSRLPIQNVLTLALPIQSDKNREPRAAIEAVVTMGNGKNFKFIATHLDHLEDDTDRLLQTNFLADRYRNDPMPFMIVGDLNALPDSKAMQALFSIAQQPAKDTNAFTWPSGVPSKKIDYFLLSKNHQWKCTKFEVIDERHISDHRPVLMDLDF